MRFLSYVMVVLGLSTLAWGDQLEPELGGLGVLRIEPVPEAEFEFEIQTDPKTGRLLFAALEVPMRIGFEVAGVKNGSIVHERTHWEEGVFFVREMDGIRMDESANSHRRRSGLPLSDEPLSVSEAKKILVAYFERNRAEGFTRVNETEVDLEKTLGVLGFAPKRKKLTAAQEWVYEVARYQVMRLIRPENWGQSFPRKLGPLDFEKKIAQKAKKVGLSEDAFRKSADLKPGEWLTGRSLYILVKRFGGYRHGVALREPEQASNFLKAVFDGLVRWKGVRDGQLVRWAEQAEVDHEALDAIPLDPEALWRPDMEDFVEKQISLIRKNSNLNLKAPDEVVQREIETFLTSGKDVNWDRVRAMRDGRFAKTVMSLVEVRIPSADIFGGHWDLAQTETLEGLVDRMSTRLADNKAEGYSNFEMIRLFEWLGAIIMSDVYPDELWSTLERGIETLDRFDRERLSALYSRTVRRAKRDFTYEDLFKKLRQRRELMTLGRCSSDLEGA